MKILKSDLGCAACEGKDSVPCKFTKPPFKQRKLVSGKCSDCGSLNRYSVYMIQGGSIMVDFIECEMSLAGKAKQYLKMEKQHVQSERNQTT